MKYFWKVSISFFAFVLNFWIITATADQNRATTIGYAYNRVFSAPIFVMKQLSQQNDIDLVLFPSADSMAKSLSLGEIDFAAPLVIERFPGYLHRYKNIGLINVFSNKAPYRLVTIENFYNKSNRRQKIGISFTTPVRDNFLLKESIDRQIVDVVNSNKDVSGSEDKMGKLFLGSVDGAFVLSEIAIGLEGKNEQFIFGPETPISIKPENYLDFPFLAIASNRKNVFADHGIRLSKFLNRYREAVNWIYQPENFDDLVVMLSEETKLDIQVVSTVLRENIKNRVYFADKEFSCSNFPKFFGLSVHTMQEEPEFLPNHQTLLALPSFCE